MPDPDRRAHDNDLTGDNLSQLIDDMEENVKKERNEEGVPGSSTDREKTEKVEPDDQAPS
ncbi:hypothetical protein HCA61_19195 [Rhodococcus sp. HNM0563]|uniref:hypothetical protein n=1 Tax=unclassified Rhodococcus (in: high G+C Gram-positive bacteria) TaxID=192944 RepID=UPI00146BA5F5|nr:MULTISPECIES: hypothetical protein [unclassified Rhodococcus (in: high G+C Gram-positive bacteria)]MCK0092605.1 hypothetical protein [Rhodococcus sp. F64268]NLU64374.1 hypothetical protein [Rhodococcus sp. HNM0563]